MTNSAPAGTSGRSPDKDALLKQAADLHRRADYVAELAIVRPLAESGEVRAQVALGRLYLDGLGVAKSPAEAADWYGKAAQQGDPDAAYMIGYWHSVGFYTQHADWTQAIAWLRQAAADKQPDALFLLGTAYDRALGGLDYDTARAMELYRQAAQGGQLEAQYLLGTRYEYGDGVDKNRSEAVRWYRLAAAQGRAEAAAALSRLGSRP